MFCKQIRVIAGKDSFGSILTLLPKGFTAEKYDNKI